MQTVDGPTRGCCAGEFYGDLVDSLARPGRNATGFLCYASTRDATKLLRVPIVFVQVIDPVGGDLVDSLARPGRNATGFLGYASTRDATKLLRSSEMTRWARRASSARELRRPRSS